LDQNINRAAELTEELVIMKNKYKVVAEARIRPEAIQERDGRWWV